MPKTYAKMTDECTDRVAHILKLFYPALVKAGVRFDLLSVASDGDGPALMHQGYAADAVVRATNVKERTKGAGDVEIVFDEERYQEMTEAERDALVDHEIHHVELKLDKFNQVKLDCRGRPKVGMKKHDLQFGWFVEIAKRHGPASGEVQQATKIFITHRQTLFDFGMGEATRLALEEATAPAGSPDAVVRSVHRIKKGLKDGESVSITTPGGGGVKIDKDGIHKVP